MREGVYHVTRELRIIRSVHIFGQGRAELRGRVTAPGDYMVHSTSSSATLDRLRIDNQTEGYSLTLFVGGGHLRLQGCDVSSRAENGYALLSASGASTLADVLGCTFRGGGGNGISFVGGASGRVEGCDIQDFSRGSCGIFLQDSGASPLVSRNTFCDCRWGVLISSAVDPAWSLGEGNIFINCAEGDVWDVRGPPPLPPPGPPPPAPA